MKFGRYLFPLLLSASVVVALGLFYVTSPAQDMPPLPVDPGSEQSASQGSATAAPQILAAATPPAAPANPPSATAPASQPAQAAEPPPQAAEPPSQAPAPAPPATPSLTQAELDQLLAPIALYPDQLLSQILMASTYPLEIVEAARWVKVPAHRRLKGDALTNALRERNWDPSVMALVPFPHVLELMNAQIEWTQKLGAAFVAQQADCMSEVQRLRQQAVAAGNFKSGPQCGCLVHESGGYVTVAPANPEVVYVPVYNAAAIYGPWLYPAYPPFLFPYPVGFAFTPGFFIGFGVGVDVAFYGPLWGWSNVNWGGGNIIVNSVAYNTISGGQVALAGGVWTHNFARAGGLTSASTTSAGRVGGAGSLTTATAHAGATTAGAAATSGHAAWSGGRSASHATSSGRYGSFAGHGGGSRASFSGHGGSHGSFAGHGGSHGGRGFGSSAPAHAMMGGGGGGHMGGGGPGHGGGGGGGHGHR